MTRMSTYLLVGEIEKRCVRLESLDWLEGAVTVEENPYRFLVRFDVGGDLPALELGRSVFDEKLGNRRKLGRACVSGLSTAVVTCRWRDWRRGQLADSEGGSEARMFMPADHMQRKSVRLETASRRGCEQTKEGTDVSISRQADRGAEVYEGAADSRSGDLRTLPERTASSAGEEPAVGRARENLDSFIALKHDLLLGPYLAREDGIQQRCTKGLTTVEQREKGAVLSVAPVSSKLLKTRPRQSACSASDHHPSALTTEGRLGKQTSVDSPCWHCPSSRPRPRP